MSEPAKRIRIWMLEAGVPTQTALHERLKAKHPDQKKWDRATVHRLVANPPERPDPKLVAAIAEELGVEEMTLYGTVRALWIALHATDGASTGYFPLTADDLLESKLNPGVPGRNRQLLRRSA